MNIQSKVEIRVRPTFQAESNHVTYDICAFLLHPVATVAETIFERVVSSAVQNNDALWFFLVSDESPSKVQYGCYVPAQVLSLMKKYTQQCWLFCVSERNQLNDKMAAACLTGLGRSALSRGSVPCSCFSISSLMSYILDTLCFMYSFFVSTELSSFSHFSRCEHERRGPISLMVYMLERSRQGGYFHELPSTPLNRATRITLDPLVSSSSEVFFVS